MTDILQGKGVCAHRNAKSCIYILEEETFSQLGYKIMLSQKVDSLLRMAKIRHNGRIELIYITKEYQSCAQILNAISRDSVVKLCSNTIDAILKVKEQGFLLCENIDLSMERIYFDPGTYEAKLVYIPLGAGEHSEELRVAAAVQKLLLQIIKANGSALSEQECKLAEALENGKYTLEELKSMFGSAKEVRLELVSMNANLPLKREIKMGDRLKIGRKKDNGMVLDFTNQISRYHCSIYSENGSFFVKDEESTFGTGLNGKKLAKGCTVRIENGDVLMLPGIKFKVNVR